jgi:hypothetical protein
LSDPLILRGHEALQAVEDGCQPWHVASSRQDEAQWSGGRRSHGCHEQPQERWEHFGNVRSLLLMQADTRKKGKPCPEPVSKFLHVQ